MLPFNRVYTPQELRAASRLVLADHHRPVVARDMTARRADVSRGRALLGLGQRLFGRSGLRRQAPSAT